MKSSILLLPLVASAATALNVARQAGRAALPFAGSKKLTPKFNAQAQRVHLRWGPVQLLPKSQVKRGGLTMDPIGQSFMISFQGGYCTDCSVLSGKVGVELQNGTVADLDVGVYTHHIDTIVNKRSSNWISSCDSKNGQATTNAPSVGGGLGMQPFLMNGDDNAGTATTYTSPDGRFKSGFHLPKGTTISASTELVNYSENRMPIYYFMELEYMPGRYGADSKTKLLSVTGCGGRRIALNDRGETRTTSNKFTIFEDGYIINGKGHLHDGGVKMVMDINGKNVCESVATYGGPSGTLIIDGKEWKTISGMTDCGKPIPVKKGDAMTITAVYDLKLHPLRKKANGQNAEVMGMWDLTFAPLTGGTA